MIPPERRTRADLTVAVLIVLVVLVAATALWWRSDARATDSSPAQEPLAAAPAPGEVPGQLHEIWRAPSPATPHPVVAGPAVVTGSDGEVTGRDPATGERAWHYSRDLPLCTVDEEWDRAVAVHATAHNCSEVTSLRGSTGVRAPQRNSDAGFGTRLLSDGTYLTATGIGSFESWRSDLVRTQQYGLPPAPKNPDNNMNRPGCSFEALGAGDEQVAVVQNCPREQGVRLTTIKAEPDDDETPEEVFSVGIGEPPAGIISVTEDRVAVVFRDRGEVLVYDSSGSVQDRFPVRTGAPDDTGNVDLERVQRASLDYWFTGTDVLALDPETLIPAWRAPDALGPAVDFGGRVLVPVPRGIAVLDPDTGARERVLPVDRQGHDGPVGLDSAGGVLLEQRGAELVALTGS